MITLFDIKDKGCNAFDFTKEDITVKQAVQALCIDCGGYEKENYYQCENKHCPLVMFNRKWVKSSIKAPKELSEEEKEVLRERMKNLKK